MGLFCAPLICSCVDDQRDLFQEPEKLPKESFFDFNMNQNLAIDIDYGFKEDDTWKRGGIYVTFVKEGTYTALGEDIPKGTIEIPDAMKDLNEMEFSIGCS